MRTLLIGFTITVGASAHAKPRTFPTPAKDCTETCQRLAICKVGPLYGDAKMCRRACEISGEDEKTDETFTCVDHAKTCPAMRKCGK